MSDQVWTQVGLKEVEYRRVVEILGREPNHVELQMFGVMWSEHCSYKHSRSTLKKLPTKGERVLQGPGENAGVIKVTDDLAVAFKIESHNHPSFVEPFQGAATGVGGILRDVFTMGARPIALLDSLRFGHLDDAKQRHLFSGVVAGIGHYGNCMGIPTVGGEVYFDDSYKGNCLVNAMCVGIVEPGKIRKGIAKGPGNPIMVVGARTGRDGIHGASLLASAEFGEQAEDKRPSVQVGDPFMEKLLLEACLELFETDAVVGIQDMGAAGLISSSSEMAARGDVGLEIDVRKVPAREEGMQAWEFLLSESQERMLVCVEKGREPEVEAIFEKWGLLSAVIGQVTDDGMLRVLDNGAVVAEVPAHALADEAPVYYPESKEPAYLADLRNFDYSTVPMPEDFNEALLKLLGSTNIGSREWVYRQYDHMVLLGTVVAPGADAALLRLRSAARPGIHGVSAPEGPFDSEESGTEGVPTPPDTTRTLGLALKTDCNARYVYLNPRRGTAIAVAEAARNCVVTGATPVAITNNLNFGNPEKPEIFWTFDQAVEGMAEACTVLGTPVTGGNVSFYNETAGEAIYPTPTIGMVAIHENLETAVTPGFKNAGDVIVLLGDTKDELGGSEYLKVIHGEVGHDCPNLDLALELKLQRAVRTAINEGLVTAAHDISDGGLVVALAEMAMAAAEGARGCQLNIFATEGRLDGHLFGETQSRVLLTVNRDNVMRLRSICIAEGLPHRLIGDVTADGRFVVAGLAPGHESEFIFRRQTLIDLPTDDLAQAHKEAIPQWMGA
ncbi:MAG: phosphoribosylformylglycinamidine synthetase [Symbiobacteriaceae bacterium]|jgi:phosphoribosylformylglycinamidine synthase|nr:phosphoribosylformylglycinamidine synthetase [Symbiobacteriaceae bacterium]